MTTDKTTLKKGKKSSPKPTPTEPTPEKKTKAEGSTLPLLSPNLAGSHLITKETKERAASPFPEGEDSDGEAAPDLKENSSFQNPLSSDLPDRQSDNPEQQILEAAKHGNINQLASLLQRFPQAFRESADQKAITSEQPLLRSIVAAVINAESPPTKVLTFLLANHYCSLKQLSHILENYCGAPTLLSLAAYTKDYKLLDYLLKQPDILKNIDQQAPNDLTPLQTAVVCGNKVHARMLLEAGAHPAVLVNSPADNDNSDYSEAPALFIEVLLEYNDSLTARLNLSAATDATPTLSSAVTNIKTLYRLAEINSQLGEVLVIDPQQSRWEYYKKAQELLHRARDIFQKISPQLEKNLNLWNHLNSKLKQDPSLIYLKRELSVAYLTQNGPAINKSLLMLNYDAQTAIKWLEKDSPRLLPTQDSRRKAQRSAFFMGCVPVLAQLNALTAAVQSPHYRLPNMLMDKTRAFLINEPQSTTFIDDFNTQQLYVLPLILNLDALTAKTTPAKSTLNPCTWYLTHKNNQWGLAYCNEKQKLSSTPLPVSLQLQTLLDEKAPPRGKVELMATQEINAHLFKVDHRLSPTEKKLISEREKHPAKLQSRCASIAKYLATAAGGDFELILKAVSTAMQQQAGKYDINDGFYRTYLVNSLKRLQKFFEDKAGPGARPSPLAIEKCILTMSRIYFTNRDLLTRELYTACAHPLPVIYWMKELPTTGPELAKLKKCVVLTPQGGFYIAKADKSETKPGAVSEQALRLNLADEAHLKTLLSATPFSTTKPLNGNINSSTLYQIYHRINAHRHPQEMADTKDKIENYSAMKVLLAKNGLIDILLWAYPLSPEKLGQNMPDIVRMVQSILASSTWRTTPPDPDKILLETLQLCLVAPATSSQPEPSYVSLYPELDNLRELILMCMDTTPDAIQLTARREFGELMDSIGILKQPESKEVKSGVNRRFNLFPGFKPSSAAAQSIKSPPTADIDLDVSGSFQPHT